MTPCLAASTATIRSFIYILNRLGDNVHSCAIPCKRSNYFGISPSSSTALLAHSVIFFIVLHIFPLIPISHIFPIIHISILCRTPSVHLETNRTLLDLCQWKRGVQKFYFKYIALKIHPKKSSYRRCGEKEKKSSIFPFFFPPTAAGGAICFFWLQIVNTLMETSSCDDRRSIST